MRTHDDEDVEAGDEGFEVADEGFERPIRRRRRPHAMVPGEDTTVVQATLANGRKTRMRLTPSPASARSVNQLRAQITTNAKRQALASAASAKAIRKLGTAQRAAVGKLTAQMARTDKVVAKRMLDGDAALDKRIAKAIAKASGADSENVHKVLATLGRQQKRALWNNILIASAMPFFAAYGDVNDPFSYDNLVLTGSLAGWMLGDEIVDKLLGDGKSPMLRSGSDFWSYAAPIGNALTVWYLLKDRQHHRFVTGINTIDDLAHPKPIPIEVAKDYKEDFATLAPRVRAVATLVSTTNPRVIGVTAEVKKKDADSSELWITPIWRTPDVEKRVDSAPADEQRGDGTAEDISARDGAEQPAGVPPEPENTSLVARGVEVATEGILHGIGYLWGKQRAPARDRSGTITVAWIVDTKDPDSK